MAKVLTEEQKAKMREYGREYRQRPDVKAKRAERARLAYDKDRHREYLREYNQRPEVKERNRALRQRPEVREYHREYNRAYYRRPEVKAKERERLYGVTPEQYDQMMIEQQGVCPICGASFVMSNPNRESKAKSWRGQPHTDHDHETKRARQILCRECNVGLGTFKDSIAALRAAIAYLQKHGKEG